MEASGDSPNIALVREAYVAFDARDGDRLRELMWPEGELYPHAIRETRTKGHHGHAGLRQHMDDGSEVDLPIGYLRTLRDGRLLRTQADPRGR